MKHLFSVRVLKGRVAVPEYLVAFAAVLIGFSRAVEVVANNTFWHQTVWAVLIIAAVFSYRAERSRAHGGLIIGAFTVAVLLILVKGDYACWQVFADACRPAHGEAMPPPAAGSWAFYNINSDTFSYLEPYARDSLRPPLYHLFLKFFGIFGASLSELDKVSREFLPLQIGAYHLGVDGPEKLNELVLRSLENANSPLLLIVRVQQIILLGAVAFFLWATARVCSPIPAGIVILALYDGGYLSHWYYTHTVESKTLYLAVLFMCMGLSLLAFMRPHRVSLILLCVCAGALVLLRPQGMLIGLLPLVAALIFLIRNPNKKLAGSVAGAGLLIFTVAAALPSIVTYMGSGIIQPTNIYALSRIPFALEVATADDVNLFSDAEAKLFLQSSLELKAAAPPLSDIDRSLARNQAIAWNACAKLNHQELICADVMNRVSSTVLLRHIGQYLGKIVLPAVQRLFAFHVFGSYDGMPRTVWAMLLTVVWLLLLKRGRWLALWLFCIIGIHVGFCFIMSAFAGVDPTYLFTSEPIALVALAVALTVAARFDKMADIRFGEDKGGVYGPISQRRV